MAIQATDSGAAAQEYTYDPTQGKIVPLAQARVVTYITDNPDGLPSSATTGKTTAAAQAAADKKARIELDPDVIAAKKLQAKLKKKLLLLKSRFLRHLLI
jgi:hypothetical protein